MRLFTIGLIMLVLILFTLTLYSALIAASDFDDYEEDDEDE